MYKKAASDLTRSYMRPDVRAENPTKIGFAPRRSDESYISRVVSWAAFPSSGLLTIAVGNRATRCCPSSGAKVVHDAVGLDPINGDRRCSSD